MKRSEMISEIETVLYNCLDSMPINKRNGGVEIAAKQLLTSLELKGMLPPISDSTESEMNGYGSTFYDIPEWEPE